MASGAFLGGGFHPHLGKIPILTNIFQMGWNHQLVFFVFLFLLAVWDRFLSPTKKNWPSNSDFFVGKLRNPIFVF